MSKNEVIFFTANERDSTYHPYRRRRLKKKHCNAKEFSKLNKFAENIQPRNMKKASFQANFKQLSGPST